MKNRTNAARRPSSPLFEATGISRLGIAVAAIVFLLCGTVRAKGQGTTAEIVGRVTDAAGASVPGASVVVKNLETGVEEKVVSNSDGDYAANLLPIGRYSVTITMPNFEVYKQDGVTLAAGDHQRINVALIVGAVTQTVEVNTAPASVQTDSSVVGNLIDTKQVQDLPLNGRNVFSLVNLTPGVTAGAGPNGQPLSSGTRPDDRRQSSAYSANGQDPSANNNLIDGVDNNDRLIGTIGVRPSIDAISEVKIQTNLYSAEVGRTSGGVVNILTKSGTNSFHGTAFEFLRNDIFDASSYYNFIQSAAAPPVKPEFRQNQFGGSAGGPILHNKLFFFGDYEGLRIIQGGTVTGIIVPTAAQRVGNFSESCTSGFTAGLCNTASQQLKLLTAVGSAPAGPVPNNRLDQGVYATNLSAQGLALAGLYPMPNAGAGVSTANYNATANRVYLGHTFDAKIDEHFSDRDTLRGRYSFNQVAVLTPTLFPNVGGFNPGSGTSGVGGSFPGKNRTRAQNLLLNYTRVISPNLLLDADASYLRDYINSENINYGVNVASQIGIPGVNTGDPQTSGLPSISITGFQGIGDANFTPLLEIDNSFEYKAAVIWTKGRHNVKIGGGFIRRQFNIEQSTSARGTFTFNTSGTPVSGPAATLADLVLGIPATLSRTLSPFVSEYRTWEPNGYAQDDWRATNWLTLNLGLRYDVFTPKTEVRDRISNLNILTGQVLYPGFDTNRTTGIKTTDTSFAPRAGFAATVRPNLVVRGGYGISFFPGDINSGALLKNPPFSPSLTCGPSTTTPCSTYGSYGTLAQGFFVPSVNFSTGALVSGLPTIVLPAGSGFTEIDQNFRNSYQHQFNVLVEKGLGYNTVSVGYVGSIGRNIVMNPADVNRALPSGTSTPNPRPISVLNPTIGTVQAFLSQGISSYNALQVSYQRRFAQGLSANAGYTYAHEIDDVTGLAGTGNSGYGTFIGSQTTYVQNIRNYDRSTGDFNAGNRGFGAVNYEFPKVNVSSLLSQAINGWQVNGTVVWQSGLPYTVTNLNTLAGVTGLTGERPNRVLSATNLGTRTYTNLGIGYINPAAFASQAQYTLGNAGRNLASGPRSSFVNASFFKNFSLPEEMKLQLRAELFNVPNHRNFGQPVTTLGSGNFGDITAVSASDAPRQIQFALKLQF